MSWPMVKLGDVCSITMGQAPKGSSYNEKGEGIALIAGAGDFGATTPEPKKFTTEASKISIIDDIILCIRATIGDINWSNNEYCLGRGVAGLRVSNKLDKNYLWYFIVANKEQLASKGTGSTFKQVSRAIISDWEIPLSPLAEQKRIAAILDKADAIRQKRQQAIKLADEFLRSVFLEMFGDPVTNPKGWETGTIRDLVTSVNYGTSAKASEIDGEFPILRMGNITYEGKWDLSDLKCIDLDDKDRVKYLAQRNDLLFNRTNSKELVGKTAVFDEDDPMAIAGYLIRVRTNEHGNPWYISGYLNSLHGKQTLLNMCKSIVGMANINAQELQDIKIMLPPIELQNQYELLVKAVKTRSSKQNNSFLDLKNLFDALSQKAFSGQL